MAPAARLDSKAINSRARHSKLVKASRASVPVKASSRVKTASRSPVNLVRMGSKENKANRVSKVSNLAKARGKVRPKASSRGSRSKKAKVRDEGNNPVSKAKDRDSSLLHSKRSRDNKVREKEKVRVKAQAKAKAKVRRNSSRDNLGNSQANNLDRDRAKASSLDKGKVRAKVKDSNPASRRSKVREKDRDVAVARLRPIKTSSNARR